MILQNDDILRFFQANSKRCPGIAAAGAVSLRKSHDIVILSFCNIVKGQAKYMQFYNGMGFKMKLYLPDYT